MVHNTPEADGSAVRRGHEIFDLDVSYVRWFSVAIVILLVATAAAAFALLGGFRIGNSATPPELGAETQASAPFATLQSAPQEELRTYRGGKAKALEGYHWIDRAGGVVQIPIERAMELVATQGAAPASKPAAAAPLPRRRRMQ
jgi:hypothetical protein